MTMQENNWQREEAEKFYQHTSEVRKEMLGRMDAFIADYWISRMKEIREEGKKEGIDWAHKQDSTQIPFLIEKGRSEAITEAIDMVNKMLNYEYKESKYNLAIRDVLADLQTLQTKQ